MTERPDLLTEMNVLLDDDTVEAILAGEANGSVPADFAMVAELARAARVNAAGAVPASAEQDKEDELIAAIASAVRASSPLRALRPRLRTRTAAVAAFAAVAFSATAAAAATNQLPPTLQNALHDAAAHVGVHLPEADAGNDPPASNPPASGEAPQHDATSASSASDAAPPASNPSDLNDDTPGNSGHDRQPGDVASVAHDDNPSSEDDAHAQSGQDQSGQDQSVEDQSDNSGAESPLHSSTASSDELGHPNKSGGNATSSLHVNSDRGKP